MKNQRYLILFMVVPTILIFLLFQNKFISNTRQFGALAVEDNHIKIIALSYGITLIGIILGCFYRQLQELKKQGQNELPGFVSFFKSTFLSIDFWMSLCASPLVLILIYNSNSNGSLSSLAVVAFENGFFITVAIEKLLPEMQKKQ